MLRKSKLLTALLLTTSTFVFAGDMGDKSSDNPSGNWDIGIEGGFSLTGEANFYPELTAAGVINPLVTIAVPSNTDWNHNFGYSGVGGVFAGYKVNQNVALQLGYRYRGGYDWQVHAAYADSNVTRSTYAINDITVQTVLFDVQLSPTSCCNSAVVPYVQAGIGYAHNNLGDIRTTFYEFGAANDQFQIINGATTNNFAWDLGLGVNYHFTPNLFFRLGYSFTDFGSVKSGNHETFHVEGTVNNLEATVVPFKADHLFAHEGTAGVGITF